LVKVAPPPEWRQLTTVGVTGTNGKTSTVWWTAACLAKIARPVAQVTTLGSFLDDQPLAVPRDFDGFLATMRAGAAAGGRFAALEMTSEALARGFARTWPCSIGVFTNLTHDHLDAHGSPEHYLASKAQLFVNLPPGGAAVLNAADPVSELIADVIPSGVRVVSYVVPSRGDAARTAELRAISVEPSWTGTRLAIEAQGELAHAPRQVAIRGIGAIFAENALASLSAALLAGVPPDAAAEALAGAPPPPGRFQVIASDGGPRVVVDYAHTPDALARTLATARLLCEGELWVVFGAGGQRDRAKRAPMGLAASAADHVVLTSDNPRAESPATIADHIRAGVAPTVRPCVVLDRRDAIRTAVREAGERDVVVIAGKGHEAEQIMGERSVPFDDAAEGDAALRARHLARGRRRR
jgi:UDP-N-acetylmuramoyl-L-alanyl-D-glutamate--2,6-diaminopimelate ligase